MSLHLKDAVDAYATFSLSCAKCCLSVFVGFNSFAIFKSNCASSLTGWLARQRSIADTNTHVTVDDGLNKGYGYNCSHSRINLPQVLENKTRNACAVTATVASIHIVCLPVLFCLKAKVNSRHHSSWPMGSPISMLARSSSYGVAFLMWS